MMIGAHPGITVRDLEDRDFSALARLMEEFTGVETTGEQVGHRVRRSRGVEHPVVAEIQGEVVGYASLRCFHYLGEDRPYAELSELFVALGSRNQGVASALLAILEQRARAAGASCWCVIVGPESPAALKLYEKSGFSRFGVALQRWFTDDRPYQTPAV